MKPLLTQIFTAFKQQVGRPLAKYLNTPVGKIILFNTALFVTLLLLRLYGILMDSHRRF